MGVVMRTVVARILVSLGVVGAATLALAPPAHAAPPTRIVDQFSDVACTGVSQGVEITVRATRSDLGGTESSVQLSFPGGDTIGGGDSTSDWGDGTFRAVIPVLDLDEQPAGDVYFSGSFTPTGEPESTRDKFNVGNVHVVQERAQTLLAVSDVVLTYDDNDSSPGDVTFPFSDLTCDGFLVNASLFFTNPATVVEFTSDLFFFPDECTTSNVQEGFIIETTEGGTIDELFVDIVYADRPEANASGLVVADGGTWEGELRLQISDEPAGTVAGTATLERERPFHDTQGDTGMRTHFQVTPYHFTLVVEGPGAPAELDCTLFQVREKTHIPNPFG